MVLTLALILDAIFGEPGWLWSRLPHPVKLMGALIGWADAQFNKGQNRRAKGALTFAISLAAAIGVGVVLAAFPTSWIDMIVAAILLSHRSLVGHINAVASALAIGTAPARIEVARIVGRDTGAMEPADIARATIESAAENFSDGVVAPAFWFVVFGLPGLLAYKFTNTADSMIGYKNDQYRDFGWAAARTDDLLNWVPARLTAVIIALVARNAHKLGEIRANAAHHRSPNAGWPEAAMASSLDVALAGPRVYDGQAIDYPFVHDEGRKDIAGADIRAAVRLMWRGWLVLLAAAVLGWIVWGI